MEASALDGFFSMLLLLHLQCLRQGIMLAVTTQEFMGG